MDLLEQRYGAQAYATYNETPGIDGKNFRGDKSPGFEVLPEQIQRGWGRASLIAAGLTYGTFGWALAQLQAGSKVARAAWGGYWELSKGWMHPTAGSDSLDEPMNAYRLELPLAHLKGGGVAPAQPYWEDMLATDWKVID